MRDFEAAQASLFAQGKIKIADKNGRDRRMICTEPAVQGVQ